MESCSISGRMEKIINIINMKKLIFLLFLIPIIGIAQEGGYRSLKTKSAKVTFTDLLGHGNKIVGVDNNGLSKVISVDGTTIILTNNVLSSVAVDNLIVQTLSGTTPVWDSSLGKNAVITLTEATTITLSNLVSGTSGNLTVINPTTSYTITFTGYTIWISQAIYYSGDAVVTSGLGKIDGFSWYYDGNVVLINGQVGYR